MGLCKKVSNCVCKKPVDERFKHFLPVFRRVRKAGVTEQKSIIKNASPCLVRLVSELGLNILKGNILLKPRQYKKLGPYKRTLLQLSKPGISIDDRRAVLLKKRGGFFPAVVPILVTALSSFAAQALANALT